MNIETNLDVQKKYVIFGAGNIGRQALDFLGKENVIFFIDNSVSKQGDNRIRLVDKKNGGLVSARKEGLKLATGDYIGFVDADDYIATEMYSELYTNLIKSESDFVYGNRIREHEDGTEIADDFNFISGEFELGIKAGVDFLKHYVFNDNNEKQIYVFRS